MRTRLLLGALGVAVAAYGAWLLLHQGADNSWADLAHTAAWLAGGVVLHDFVLVPLTLLLGLALIRLLPSNLRAPVAGGLVVLGTVTLMAVPVLGGWGANVDNPTILDRNYTAGWLVVAGVTILVVVLTIVLRAGGRSGGPGAGGR
jgi:hypothetical protein